ncbi:MAG: hypothetical protein EHM12_00005 [Dehalococcoidia bacterium]|nr:MAG: hypothetical protein EHM12_00005 [Dehalococcoidia bacterium]
MIATSSKIGNSDPAFLMSGGPQISAIVYAPNGKAYLSGGSGPDGYSVWGSVVARNLLMDGSTSIQYLSGIHTMSHIPGPGIGGTANLERFDYR